MRLMSTQTFFFFFFNDTATTEIYTLSLHDALPIFLGLFGGEVGNHVVEKRLDTHGVFGRNRKQIRNPQRVERSEEHTSELQSQSNLVCRLLLEKKKKTHTSQRTIASSSGRRSCIYP